MTCRRYRQAAGVVLAAALAASCGDTAQQGRSPAYLVMDGLTTISGDNVMESDVVTNGTVFEDKAEVQLHVALKDPGTPASPLDPSPMNSVTVDRYHVKYIRADGRNTQGVDVPYEFDGAATGTIGGASSKLSFVLVRLQAKLEAPLKALEGHGGAMIISTIAEVSFYGKDQAGNAVSVTGRISVNFADWGDPTGEETTPTSSGRR